MKEVIINVPDSSSFIGESNQLAVMASKNITTVEECRLGADLLLRLKALEKKIINTFKQTKADAYSLHQNIRKLETDALKETQEKMMVLKIKIAEFNNEQIQRKKREQEEIQYQAKLAIEKQQIEQAQLLGAEGKLAEAEKILTTEVIVPDAPPPEDVEGVEFRVTREVEVYSLETLVKSIASGGMPITYIEPNMKKLNELGRKLKETFNVPGCRVVEKKTVVAK